MRSTLSSMASAVMLCTLALAQDATVVTNNPVGVSYGATLPDLTTTDIRGSVVASSDASGTGVLFQVSMSGFSDDGPFLYHIHQYPITGGNCSTAGGHLDPFLRGDSPTCDASSPATCQVGDLSGKHGKINETGFSANYVDDYVSLLPGAAAFMGNRSLVVHYSNKTIITCASFSQLLNGTIANSSVTSTGSGSSSTAPSSAASSSIKSTATGSTRSGSASGTATASPSSSTGGAAALLVNGGAVAVGLIALVF